MKCKVVNMVSINGEYVDYKTLPYELKVEIGNALNERALKQLGFVKVEEEEGGLNEFES